MQRFTGKVAVITGGTSGIGLATAQRLYDEGASVVIAARKEARGQVIAKAMGAERTMFMPVDVADRAALDGLFAATVLRFGRLDVLVNNAGISHVGAVETLDRKRWQRVLDVNLTSVFDACQAALPWLRTTKRDFGVAQTAIVNVASLTSIAGEPGMAVYAAAKAAVANFTQSLAGELIREGIRVNAVSPGAVDTPLAALSTTTPEILAAFQKAIPAGRFGRPEEIAAAIAFLAADEAGFCVGTNLVVDGGVTALTGHPNLLPFLNSPQ